jgi:DNA-binding IclR family transcriptional regulator
MSLQGVGRTAAVLLAFTSGEAVLGVSEVARRVELPKSAVHRIMDSLAGSGLLARDEDRDPLPARPSSFGAGHRRLRLPGTCRPWPCR